MHLSKMANGKKISIHAPREGSDAGRDDLREGVGISIHAPREGSDSARPAAASTSLMLFLSTLPARGATLVSPPVSAQIAISIHAPREGSDSKCAEK